jgi:hypothetical protein
MEPFAMQYDISALTFYTEVQVQENDLVAHLPSNLASKADLFSQLQIQLHFSSYISPNWHDLHDWLRAPQDWTQCSRIVLIHGDIPLLHSEWHEARTYLGIVIDSILHLKAIELPSHPMLVAAFPVALYEQIQALLNRPAPWYASIGMRQETGPTYLLLKVDPTWYVIPPLLERLDGLTVEYFELNRENHVSLTVTYLRQYAGYYMKYYTIAESAYTEARLLLSSPIKHNLPTQILSLAEVLPIVQYFYEHGDILASSQWYVPSMNENDLDELFIHWYYHDEEIEFVERPGEMVHTMIYEGMAVGVDQEQKLLSIKDWQTLSLQQDIAHDQYLTALCVLGLEHDPTLYERFLALLDSRNRQERWVSAHFLGLKHDERALPVLIMMLTEELLLPYDAPSGDWTYNWREYAPKLLRTRQTPAVLHALYHALQSWIAAEPSFQENDYDFRWWMNFEASLCYELGYRDAFELVLQLRLQGTHHQFLLVSMAQGYYTKSHGIGFRDEIQQELRRHTHTQTVEKDMLDILETRCHFSREQAQALLKAYHEAFYESEISF